MADRVERLTNLLALLLETRRPLTLIEISDELAGQYPDTAQARRAAFERDKAALREIGVEISSETFGGDRAGEMGYWVDRRAFELPELHLDDDEIRALQVALATTRPDSAIGEEALWKLGGTSGDVGGPVRMHLPELESLPALRTAVSSRHVVSFHYGGAAREVEPWGLLLREGFWYLLAHDRGRSAKRTFRVDRIEGAIAIDSTATFDRPPGIDLSAALPSDPLLIGADNAEVRNAMVRISAQFAGRVELEVGAGRVVRRESNGSIIVELPFVNEDALRSWVLGFLDAAELLEPIDVRERLVAWLGEVV